MCGHSNIKGRKKNGSKAGLQISSLSGESVLICPIHYSELFIQVIACNCETRSRIQLFSSGRVYLTIAADGAIKRGKSMIISGDNCQHDCPRKKKAFFTSSALPSLYFVGVYFYSLHEKRVQSHERTASSQHNLFFLLLVAQFITVSSIYAVCIQCLEVYAQWNVQSALSLDNEISWGYLEPARTNVLSGKWAAVGFGKLAWGFFTLNILVALGLWLVLRCCNEAFYTVKNWNCYVNSREFKTNKNISAIDEIPRILLSHRILSDFVLLSRTTA